MIFALSWIKSEFCCPVSSLKTSKDHNTRRAWGEVRGVSCCNMHSYAVNHWCQFGHSASTKLYRNISSRSHLNVQLRPITHFDYPHESGLHHQDSLGENRYGMGQSSDLKREETYQWVSRLSYELVGQVLVFYEREHELSKLPLNSYRGKRTVERNTTTPAVPFEKRTKRVHLLFARTCNAMSEGRLVKYRPGFGTNPNQSMRHSRNG